MKKILMFLMIIFAFSLHAEIIAQGDDCGDDCRWEIDDEGKMIITGTGNMYNWKGVSETSYGHDWGSTAPWDKYYNTVTSLDISGISNVGSYAFRHFFNLSKLNISDSVTTIAIAAFDHIPSLQNLTLPASLREIEQRAFQYNNFSSITIPDEVTLIGTRAFYYNLNLNNLYCAEEQKEMCREALKNSDFDDERIDNVLKTYQKIGNQYFYNGKFYQTSSDIGSPNYLKKRIYTVEEAEKISKKTGNTFKLRYK